MRKNFFSIAGLLIVVFSSSLYAQSSASSIIGQRWYYNSPSYGYGGYGWSGGTSLHGDYLQGRANFYRARGAYLQSYAKAMINYQEARKKYIENQEKLNQLYWEHRRERAARRKAKQDERARRRRAIASRRSSEVPKPPRRLTPSELDPSSGKIFWPSALESDLFAEDRKKLEELFVLRAHSETIPGHSAEIYQTARDMKDKLKMQIKSIPQQKYLVARKFLVLLSREGRFPRV